MDAELLLFIAANAVKAATGEDVHTVQTFEKFVSGKSYIVTTVRGRSFLVRLHTTSMRGDD